MRAELARLPPGTAIAALGPAFVDAVRAAKIRPLDWTPVRLQSDGREVTVYVTADALRVGPEGDSVRIATTARVAQQIADLLGAHLPTPIVLDAVAALADVRLTPSTQDSWRDGSMARVSRMLEHDRDVSARVAGRRGLVDNPGKSWVLSRKVLSSSGMAANYGWHVRTGGYPGATYGTRVLQPFGHAHNWDHVDYSQTVRLMRADCLVDGASRRIVDVLRHPELAGLLSHEGPLGGARYPIGGPVPSETSDTHPSLAAARDWDDPDTWRVLRRGMAGEDVAAWQRVLLSDGRDLGRWGSDGDFGGLTHNATVGWQRARGLTPDGVVGRRTRLAVGSEAGQIVPPLAVVPKFMQAKNFTRANRQDVRMIVLHSMEAAEASTTAENVARWFAGASAPRASAHYCVDADSVVQCVREEDVAWHAPGANSTGIGIEHAGYARQTRAQWLDDYSSAMLTLSARLVADICRRWAIDPVFVGTDALKRGERGITTHDAVSKAFGKSDHWDPGKGFPMDWYLGRVAMLLGGGR